MPSFGFKTRSGRNHKVEVIERRPFKFREFIHRLLIKLKLADHKWRKNYTSSWDTDFEDCSICGEYKDE